MNQKGTTLVEVLASITIISMCTAILYGSFSTIISFIQDSNLIKDASNSMMSVIEGGETDTNVSKTVKQINYKISYKNESGLSKTVNVKSSLGTYKSNLIDKVILKSFVDRKNALVGDYADYRTLMDNVKELNDARLDQEKKFLNSGYLFTFMGYSLVPNYILNDYSSSGEYFGKYRFQESKFDAFPSSLLPSSMKDGSDYFVRIMYPWDYQNSIEDKAAHQGGPIIFLSKSNVDRDEPTNCVTEKKCVNNICRWETTCDTKMEVVHIIYDYTSDTWYYNPTTGYQISISDIGSYKKEMETGFSYNGSFSYFTCFESSGGVSDPSKPLLDHIKSSNSGWKYLNIQEEYDGGDIDYCWQDIKKK